jgi:predicted nucleic acid-binding protein
VTEAVVLDTSLALKLVLPEEGYADQADALIRNSLLAGRSLLVPSLLFIEATNALLQRARRGSLNLAQASAALEQLLGLPLRRVQPPGVYEHVLSFAIAHQLRSAYDTLYVVSARLISAELWTADQNLLNALGGSAPWVRWIGDYPVPERGGGSP